METNWTMVKGKIQQKWGKLTNDDIDVIDGNRNVLLGKLREQYDMSETEAEVALSSWEKDNNVTLN